MKGNTAQRREAVEVLGEFRCVEAVEPLIACLSDADPSVRNLAVRGLYETLSALFPYRRFDPTLAPFDAGASAAAEP